MQLYSYALLPHLWTNILFLFLADVLRSFWGLFVCMAVRPFVHLAIRNNYFSFNFWRIATNVINTIYNKRSSIRLMLGTKIVQILSVILAKRGLLRGRYCKIFTIASFLYVVYAKLVYT